MKVAIGGDHAGFDYKASITEMLKSQGIEVEDFGPFSAQSCDYPDFVHPVAESVEDDNSDFGVIICGSANGVAMTANKHQSIRAAIAWETEIAKLAREHNDANIVAIPARFIDLDKAKLIVDTFLETSFEGGRHQNRVDKISC